MRFPIPLLLFVLCSVGCNGLIATVPADPEPVEISIRDRVLQELEQLKPLDDYYRGVRDELSQTVKRQQEELDALLWEEHQNLLRSDEHMVGLFSAPSDRKLQGSARSLCRRLLTLEAVENYVKELAPVIEHAELWLQLSPPVAGVDQRTSLDTEHLIVVMGRLRRDVPKVPDVADYQVSAVLNDRLDDLRQQVAWKEAEAANQQQMIQQQLYQREVENQAWANLQRAQVCDWPSIGLRAGFPRTGVYS